MATQGQIPVFGTFAERIRFVAAGRRMKPWTDALAIPAGTRARMLKDEGIPPTYEMLVRLMRVEAVSLSWLLGATVAPYLVNRTLDDAETGERLEQLLRDEMSWRVTVLMDGNRAALLLHQPAAIDVKARTIDYTAIELIAGPVGERAMAQLRDDQGRVVEVVRVPQQRMREIYSGLLGTFQFFGNEKHPGLLKRKGIYSDKVNSLEAHNLRVAEGIPESDDVPRALAPIARWWPLLTDAERDAITTLLDPVIEKAARRQRAPA